MFREIKRVMAAACLALLCIQTPLTSCAPRKEQTMHQKESDGAFTVTSTSPELPAALRSLTVENDTSCGGVIARDSVFRITTAAETTAEELSRCLRVSPAADFEITGEKTEFTMRPRAALRANTLYRFTVADPDAPAASLLTPASFVFQTEDTARVTGTFPADLAEDVPADTGIEITVSGVLDTSAELASFVGIEPAIPFRTEVYAHGKTLVVIPTQKLDCGTAYTVSVRAGLPFADGRTTAEEKRFTFRVETSGEEDEQLSLGYAERELTAAPGEAASFRYYIHGGSDARTASDTVCAIYRYPDAAAAAAALLAYEENADGGRGAFTFPTSGLTEVARRALPTEGGAAQRWGYGTEYSVTLPALPEGVYLVCFTAAGEDGGERYALDGQLILQSTSVTVGSAAAGDDLVLWVHNGENPLAGSPVTAYLYDRIGGWQLRERTDGARTVEDCAGTTDADGVCRLDTKGRGSILAVIGTGERSRYAAIGGGSRTSAARRVYIYTDRETYLTTDTVRFWGVVTPQAGLTSLYCASNAADGITVPVSADGTFSGSLSYADYAGYGVSLSFADADGNSVASAYKRISREEKPVYVATAEPDRAFYRRGETPEITLRVSFYDGTPAGGLRFLWDAGEFGSGEIVTDESGTARVTLDTGRIRPRSTAPQFTSVRFELSGDEASALSAYARVLYFHSDVILETERAADGAAVLLWQLDTAALTDTESYYRIREQLKGAPAAGEIGYALTRTWYETVVTGTQYDPITKRTRELTNAERHEETLASGTAQITSGRAVLPYVEEPVADSSYRYTVTYRDGAYTYTYYVSAEKPAERAPQPESEPGYALAAIRADGTDAGQHTGSFAPGERFTLRVTRDGAVPAAGRTLFVYMDPDGVSAVRLGAQTDAAEFAGRLAPYSRAAALYFDGRDIAAALTYDLCYDYAALNQLTLTVEADAERCLPGETVGVTVRVADPDGNAVPHAEVLLSVTDEASFALGEQTLEANTPLEALIRFTPIDSAVNAHYTILDPPYRPYLLYAERMYKNAEVPMEAAEAADSAAGGDSVYVRSEFADNAFFETAQTDENGAARFAVRIPDNITSWRLSAVARAASGADASPIDVSMGAARGSVVCSQPFFVTASLAALYITGDDIAVNARYSGTEDAGTASYTAVVSGADGREIASAAAEAGRGATARFNFGKLPAGDYRVTVTARADDRADAVRHSFSVVDSAILLPVNRILAPAEASALSPSLYPVTLCFFDASNALVSRAVTSVLSAQNGRMDAKMAALAAYRICKTLWGADTLYDGEIASLTAELNASSDGCRLYSWAETDPVLTAKICLLSADVLSYSAAEGYASYFTDVLAETSDGREAAAALLGLAALGRPILTDLRFARENLDAFCGADDVARLYLAAAFAAAGDRAAASEIYTDCARVLRREDADGVSFGGSTMEETLELSYAALLCASLCDAGEAEALMTYLSRRTSAYEMYVLEEAVFAAAFAPDGMREKTLTYTLGGETHTETITGRRPFCLTLHRDSYAGFAVTAAEDDILVRAMYTGTPEEACAAPLGGVTVEKSIEPCGQGTDLYRVTVTVCGATERDSFSATLSDRIPSGARFVRLEDRTFNGSAHTWGWLTESGDVVTGTLGVWSPPTATTAGRQTQTYTAS